MGFRRFVFKENVEGENPQFLLRKIFLKVFKKPPWNET
jgi:hypothetical protein